MGVEDEKLLSLIGACVEGKEEAWHTFVSHYGKVVRGCLLGYFRGKAEKIDDITQQVFIKLWKAGLRDFRGTNRYQFLSYLKQISIKLPSSQQEKKITELVNKMLELQKKYHDEKISGTEKERLKQQIDNIDYEIDELVYRLYEITEEEKKIIEESLK